MGIYHVLSISDDLLRLNTHNQSEIEAAVGKAIYTLCINPEYGYLNGPDLDRVTSSAVLNRGAAINYAGEYHHTAFEPIIWNRGWCNNLADLSDNELEYVFALLEAEKARRI